MVALRDEEDAFVLLKPAINNLLTSPVRLTRMTSSFILSALLFLSVSAPTQSIPETHATTLANAPVNLPADLKGHPTVLILGFSQSSREAVTKWARRLAADYRDSPTVLYYEMPVVAEVPRMLRGMVIRKIRQDVPERAQPRFVPITDHEEEWKAVSGYSKQGGEDAAYLIVLDPTGKVQSRRAAGVPTDESYAAVKQTLEAMSR